MLCISLNVLELHILQLLHHALFEGLRVFEDLTADGFLFGCEHLIQEEVITLDNPGQTATHNSEQNQQKYQNFHHLTKTDVIA